MSDMSDIFDKKEDNGVCVQASTLGSLEALLEFLGTDAVRFDAISLRHHPLLCLKFASHAVFLTLPTVQGRCCSIVSVK